MNRNYTALIRKWLAAKPNRPEGLKLEGDLSPFDIFSLSSVFPKLNLVNENILMATYEHSSKPLWLLTDKKLYIKSLQGQPEWLWSEVTPAMLESCLDGTQVSFLSELFDVLKNPKQEERKTLDDFISQLSSGTEKSKEQPETVSYIDQSGLDLLAHECEAAATLCAQLNEDDLFVQALNMSLNSGDQSIDGYKAEHLFLADLLAAYRQVAFTENEKGRFTLACYFERLQGNRLYQNIGLQRLNQMVVSPAFIENINRLKAANYLDRPAEYANSFLVPALLFKIGHTLAVRAGNLIYRFASLVARADGAISEEEKLALSKILDSVARSPASIRNSSVKPIPADDSLEQVMAELNALVGLDSVKKNITELTNLLKIQRLRKEKGLGQVETTLHAVFMGPPGTGKTTVARLLGRIYKHLGFLSKGHLVETDRAGLVAGYVGQTALKVDELVAEAKGGVLFIDEAYSLISEDNGRDFGSEAVDILLKRMEDFRNDLVVVVAGYSEPMTAFIDSNPGLRSRFGRFLFFEHFIPEQLISIYKGLVEKHDFILSDEAAEKLDDTFSLLYEKRDESFGNARTVRNLFEQCVLNQANRLASLADIEEQQLKILEETDIPEPNDLLKQVFSHSD